MRIIVHIPSEAHHYIAGASMVASNTWADCAMELLIQKKDIKAERRPLFLRALSKFKSFYRSEARHFRLANRNHEFFLALKNRLLFHIFFNDVRIYEEIKRKRLTYEFFSDNVDLSRYTSIKLIGNINEVSTSGSDKIPCGLIMLGGPYVKKQTLENFQWAINLHLGALPEYGGSRTIEWPIAMKNYRDVGFTIHAMTKYLDDGLILAQEKCPPDFNFDVIGLAHAYLFRRAFNIIPVVVNKLIKDSFISDYAQTSILKNKKIYYGYQFNPLLYRELIRNHKRVS